MKTKIVYNSNIEPPIIPKEAVGAWEIVSWIADDIQESLKQIEGLISKLKQVLENENSGLYLGTGNAHSLYVYGNYIYLYCQFNEEQKVLFTIEQMIILLEQYLDFFQGDCRSSIIEVEYIAEGKAAEDQFIELANVTYLSDIIKRSPVDGQNYS